MLAYHWQHFIFNGSADAGIEVTLVGAEHHRDIHAQRSKVWHPEEGHAFIAVVIAVHQQDDLQASGIRQSLGQKASVGHRGERTLHLRSAFLSSSRSCGKDEVSTMVVGTFSGVPSAGGSVMGGKTCWILVVTKASLTNDVSNELLPVASSPHTQTRTAHGSIWRRQSRPVDTYQPPCSIIRCQGARQCALYRARGAGRT